MPQKTPAARSDSTFRARRRAPAVKPGRKAIRYDLSTLTPAQLAFVRALAALHLSGQQREPVA